MTLPFSKYAKSCAGLRVPALLYHEVHPERAAEDSLAVTDRLFERQIRHLAAAGYRGICASDWIAHVRAGQPMPPKPILITMDDAYEGVVLHALPVLRRYGFGATVFVITGAVGSRWQGRRVASARQIREWSRNGIEFGAHTRTHPDLRTVWGARLRDEIAGSKDELAQMLGFAPRAFAYPFGGFTSEALDCARDSFESAFSTEGGLNTGATDPHLLRRCVVFHNDSSITIRCAAMVGFNPIFEIRKAVGIRRRLAAYHEMTSYRF